MSELEVELWSTTPQAVESTRLTLEAIGGMLFERDGRWFVGTVNPGFIEFAAVQQGYVKRVIRTLLDDHEEFTTTDDDLRAALKEQPRCPHGNGLSCRECQYEAEAEDATWD